MLVILRLCLGRDGSSRNPINGSLTTSRSVSSPGCSRPSWSTRSWPTQDAPAAQRLLPARVVVYYVLGLALFGQCSYEEVMRMLVEGLSWTEGWDRPWSVPTKAALFKARARLGPEPFDRAVQISRCPARRRDEPRRLLRGLASHGDRRDDARPRGHPANSEHFGRPGQGGAKASRRFPQLRVVGLGECGTHALVDAAVGSYHDSEKRLWPPSSSPRSVPDMLLFADRGFYGFELWKAAVRQEQRCAGGTERPRPARRGASLRRLVPLEIYPRPIVAMTGWRSASSTTGSRIPDGRERHPLPAADNDP